MTTLMHVHNEWKRRPAPERFYDVADVIPILEREHKYERAMLVPMDAITVTADSEDDGGLYLNYPSMPKPVALNHWSFQGLADQLDIGTKDIRSVPARYVAPILEYRLKHASGSEVAPKNGNGNGVDEDEDTLASIYGEAVAQSQHDTQSRQINILVAPDHNTLMPYAKSITSATYGRYSDLQLARNAMLAVERGWRTPRAMSTGNNPYPDGHIQADRIATHEDEMKCSLVKAGMRIGPAGVYRGDRNIFIFLASDLEVLEGHFRFVTLENSEVGENRALKATFGLMNYVCMNHILWGVTNAHKITKKHRRGEVGEFANDLAESLELVAKSSPIPQGLFDLAKRTELGKNKEEVIDAVYSRRLLGLTQKAIGRAFDTAEQNPRDADGAPPTSVWGIVQGITRYSQALRQADARHQLDQSAGKLLDELKLDDAPKSVSVPATIETDMVVSSTPVKSGRKTKTASK